MTLHRKHLPQLDGGLFLSDGGIETTLLFHNGIDLPHFAAYPLLHSDEGRETLRSYLSPYLECARRAKAGFVIETPTWRANADWGALLGHDVSVLDSTNRRAVAEAGSEGQ